MSLLEVKNLTKRYGNELAVDDVTFLLEERTATALIGPNGSGKTTTLSMMGGLLRPTAGSINWNSGSGIGFLPQYPRFFPWLTALEFMEMAAKISGVDAKHARAQSMRTLEFVGLKGEMKKKTGAFSGGMKQRLGLAQAIVHQPQLLLLDEPVSALDPAGRREIMDLLKSLQQDTTILYSTHILNDAEEMTDQLLFLQNGRLVEQGSLADVRSRYAEPRIRVKFSDTAAAAAFTEKAPWEIKHEGNAVYIPVIDGRPALQEVLNYFAANSAGVTGIEHQAASLEEIFLKVAGVR
ncbi:ABC transporter ATP-binding protein [Planococcus lenghuensis]|uniref:ABC transporter ATP-binding protein n=1 Tax=Planococcus lenghuensis TaxID=2213202 RepID=A0A1Q2L1W4_9BACL|nr:ABC transporter ATP-binding protein [Planococcus lenghuensis]AQQ54450.1 ABC transporter ATP-binding protein [Planococcus lenghuensis]